MNELGRQGPVGPYDAAARVAEIARLFESIRQVIDHSIAGLGTVDGQTPKTVIAKLTELQSAHLKVLAAEEAFHGKQAQQGGVTDVDFDTIRTEIGRKLDRLRKAVAADQFPVDVELCSACRAALSL